MTSRESKNQGIKSIKVIVMYSTFRVCAAAHYSLTSRYWDEAVGKGLGQGKSKSI